jgi:Tol biopolymer transport system component
MRKIAIPWVSIGLAIAVLLILAGASAYAQYGGGAPQSIAFYSARDGHPNTQIYVMNPDGSCPTPLIPCLPTRITYDAGNDTWPDISPNGQQIIFTSDQTGNSEIFLRDRSGSVQNLTDNPATDEWARWSPDGKQIVFDSNRDSGDWEIYVMNADGSNPTRLTNHVGVDRYPDWSPDGKQILFRRGIDIYTMNADGSGTPTQLTFEVPPSFAQMAVWSPDGRYIAFMSFREGYCSVFRMNADGSQQVNLTPKEPADLPGTWCSRAPSWSANGQEIYFMSFRPSTLGHTEIFVMNMDGTNVRQLTDNSFPNNGGPSAR